MRYAGFWIRLAADIIDSIILQLASYLIEFILLWIFYLGWSFWLTQQGQTAPPFSDAFNALWLQIFNLGIYFVIAFPYFVWGHFKYGTTLGKLPFKIFVVQYSSGAPITLKQSIGRFFAYGLSYIVLCTGFIMAAFQPEKRALHDLLAGTASIIRKPAIQKSETDAAPDAQ
jgi:uncharacterized RDD family membrane protein YckC